MLWRSRGRHARQPTCARTAARATRTGARGLRRSTSLLALEPPPQPSHLSTLLGQCSECTRCGSVTTAATEAGESGEGGRIGGRAVPEHGAGRVTSSPSWVTSSRTGLPSSSDASATRSRSLRKATCAGGRACASACGRPRPADPVGGGGSPCAARRQAVAPWWGRPLGRRPCCPQPKRASPLAPACHPRQPVHTGPPWPSELLHG